METGECPCIDCLLIPICKYKKYGGLIDCSWLHNFLFNGESSIDAFDFNIRMAKILKELNIESIYHK